MESGQTASPVSVGNGFGAAVIGTSFVSTKTRLLTATLLRGVAPGAPQNEYSGEYDPSARAGAAKASEATKPRVAEASVLVVVVMVVLRGIWPRETE